MIKNKGWREAPDGSGKAPKHVIAASKKRIEGVSKFPMKKTTKAVFKNGEGTKVHELINKQQFVITNPDWVAELIDKEINIVAYAEVLDFNEIDSSGIPIRVGKDVYKNIEEADKHLENYDNIEEFPVVVEVSIMVHPKDLSKTIIDSATHGSGIDEKIVKNREIILLFDIYSYGGGVPINMESVSGSHNSTVDSIILDVPSRFGGSIKVRYFKNDDDAEDYIRNVYAHNLQAVMTMVGFYLDQPVNLMGTSGWNILEHQHKGKELYR